jgi:hypothetical protein
MAAPFCADADAQTGKPAADHQNVRINDFHEFPPFKVSGSTFKV